MVLIVLVNCCKDSVSFPQGTTGTENGLMMVFIDDGLRGKWFISSCIHILHFQG